MKEIKEKIKEYKEHQVIFAKPDYKEQLERRKLKEKELIPELLSLKNLVKIESEEREFRGKKEIRYKVYFIYSNSKGRCYSLKFNKILKIITVYPLGRKTLNKWRKKNKGRKK